MIKNSFCFLPGIGPARERALWEAGILSWDDFLKAQHPPGVSPAMMETSRREVSTALIELERGNPGHFAGLLDRGEHWRLFEEFCEDAVCLDIETTGLSADYCDITVVGLYGRGRMMTLIHGEDLNGDTLERELSHYKMLVTYFGSAFDVPFLVRKFPNIRLHDILHFDLCFGARRLGLTGGLKMLEKKLGLRRSKEVTGIDGYEAVRLWNDYRQGDAGALDLLVAYNMEDTRNLSLIAPIIFDMLRDRTGIDDFIPGPRRTPPPARRKL